MGLRRVILSIACTAFAGLYATIAVADGGDCGTPLPTSLPLDGTVIASTCPSGSRQISAPPPSCQATGFPNPTTISSFTLAHPARVDFALVGFESFDAAMYVSGDGCGESGCGPELPAGDYCVVVTASPPSALGSCGCFALYSEADAETVFRDGFE